MELAHFLNTLRDPAGLPFYPIVFQFLMVLTFALHIAVINVVVGGTSVAVWEAWRGGDNGKRLSRALGRAGTVLLSLGIVLGVAPLLFVQVIYDPFWYTANTMSAVWAMCFLVFVCTAFYALYGFYLGNKGGGNGEGGSLGLFWAYVALGAMILAGLIIHMLSMEALHPELWRGWIVKQGHLLTGGARFHGVSPGRILHFLFASFAVTGVYLMLYAWYFRPRSDYPKGYLDYVYRKGASLALYGTLFAGAAGFWWTGEVPARLGFTSNPVFLLSVILAVVLLLYLARTASGPSKDPIPIAIFMFLVIFTMAYAREILRMKYLGAFDYSIFSYPLNVSWSSTILFFATFITGILVLCFPVVAAFKAGRQEPGERVLIPPIYARIANGILILWFVVVAGLGVIISLKNGTLF